MLLFKKCEGYIKSDIAAISDGVQDTLELLQCVLSSYN